MLFKSEINNMQHPVCAWNQCWASNYLQGNGKKGNPPHVYVIGVFTGCICPLFHPFYTLPLPLPVLLSALL